MLTIILWILVALIVVIFLGIISFFVVYTRTVNTLVALDQRCETALSDIDVHLKHRHNLIPGLVSVVKGVADHERSLILGVTEAQTKALSAITPDVRLKAEGALTAQIGVLLAAAEKHPDLKAVPEFGHLRQQLVDCENRITAARRFFNLAIEEYNTGLRQFPGSYVASKRRMSDRQPFNLGIERVLIDEPVVFSLSGRD